MSKRKMSSRYKYNNEHNKGGGNSSIFNFPSEVKFFKLKDGKRFNFIIIPYIIKSENHPLVKIGEAEVGDLDFVMDVLVHRNIGGSENDIFCLKNLKKKCPICEASAEARERGKDDDAQALYPSRRVYYNIWDQDSDDMFVFTSSHKYFAKELTNEAVEQGAKKGLEQIEYAGPEEWKVVSFRADEESWGKAKYFKCTSFRFEDTDVHVSDKKIEAAISFDEIMKVLSYDEMSKILYGNEDEDEDEKNDSRDDKGNRRDDSEVEDNGESKSRGRKDRDEEEEEEKSKTKKRTDDNEKSETEERQSRKTDKEEKKPEKKECPEGFEFGKDVDKHKQCDNCKIWDDCDETKRKKR